MNTLPRALTARLFDTPDGYQRLRAHWRALVTSPQRRALRAEHHLLYLALLGRDWRRGFRPTFKESKIRGGQFAYSGLNRALAQIHWTRGAAPWLDLFGDTVSADMVARLLPLLAITPPTRYEPAEWADGTFPFDAYHVERPERE